MPHSLVRVVELASIPASRKDRNCPKPRIFQWDRVCVVSSSKSELLVGELMVRVRLALVVGYLQAATVEDDL